MTKINDILRNAVLLDITANQISTNNIIKNQEKQIFNQINNKNLYELNYKKKNELLKIYKKDYKKTMPQRHKWVFTFYIISIILPLLVILSSLLNISIVNLSFSSLYLMLSLLNLKHKLILVITIDDTDAHTISFPKSSYPACPVIIMILFLILTFIINQFS